MTVDPTNLDTLPAAIEVAGRERFALLKRLAKNPLGVAAIIILSTIVLLAVLAPILAPYDPALTSSTVLAGPGGGHPLGTDSNGRDIWSRLLFGAQSTLAAAAVAAIVSLAIGAPAGLLAGYYGGCFDSLSNWATNILMALPSMIVLLAVRAAVGPSVFITMVILGIMMSSGTFRLVRTSTQAVRNELYVDAARVAGLSDARILGRHLLRVVRAPLIIQAAVIGSIAISIQSALEFLGLGDPDAATWGSMIGDGFRNIYLQPLALLWPSLAIALVMGGLVLLANALRDALEDQVQVTEKRVRRQAATVPATPTEATATPSPVTVVEPSPADPASGTHLAEVSDLQIQYPRAEGGRTTVVDGVSWWVDRDEVLGIVGESGSGKSQTAFAMLGLLPANAIVSRGRILLEGVQTVDHERHAIDQDKLAALRGRKIAYIPQEPMSNLDPSFTIGSQLVRPMMRTLDIGKAQATDRALELLGMVGIKDPRRVFGSYAHEVSGGMAQRILIAGAISCEPDLLIADEPTTALDVTVQAEVLDVLRELQRELHQGIVLVTHNFGVVSDICDRVVVMQQGRVVEQGDVRTVLRQPTHPYTRTLLDAMLVGKEPRTRLLTGDVAGGSR